MGATLFSRRAARLARLAVTAATLGACGPEVDAPKGSELAREYARRLCALQGACECGEEIPRIRDCEDAVAEEFDAIEEAAIASGLRRVDGCVDELLGRFDWYAACESYEDFRRFERRCPIYTGDREVGETCAEDTRHPPVDECRPGLECKLGFCRDVYDPPVLGLGERCSLTQSFIPTGNLGVCAPGLSCDGDGTMVCEEWIPPAEPGEVCIELFQCTEGNYCNAAPEDAPSADDPGICMPATVENGEPCEYFGECRTSICSEGRCFQLPPAVCGVLSTWSERLAQ